MKNLRAVSLGISLSLMALPIWAEKHPTTAPPVPYYMPHLLGSVSEAADKIQFAAPNLFYAGLSGAKGVQIGRSGVQISFSEQGVYQQTQYFWSMQGGYNAPVSTPYNHRALFSMNYSAVQSLRMTDDSGLYICLLDGSCDELVLLDRSLSHGFLDALLTLIVAGGNDRVIVLDLGWDSVDKKVMKKFKLTDARLITEVETGSPGDQAGVKAGDILTAVDGTAYHMNLYGESVSRDMEKGTRLSLLRNGAPLELTVRHTRPFTPEQAKELQAKAAALAAQIDRSKSPAATPVHLGLQIRAASVEDAKASKMDKPTGLTVVTVDPGGLADSAKVKPGDTLLEINGKPVQSTDDVRQILTNGPIHYLMVWRAGEKLLLAVAESL